MSQKHDFYIFSTDWKPNLASQLADRAEVIGDNLDPAWTDNLLASAEREKIEVLIPIRTDDLAPIAANLKRFRNLGIEPTLPSENPDIIRTITDKLHLYEVLNDDSIPIRKNVDNVEDLREAAYSFGYPEKHVCIKPAIADGSRGFRILDAGQNRKERFFKEKPDSTYSDLETICSILGDTFQDMLVMEYLPGKEYTVDILCKDGIVYAVLPRLRTHMTGGITTGGLLCKNEHYDFFVSYSRRIVKKFGLSYNIGIQMREDQHGSLKLLEINPRLQGTTILSVEGGVNIPDLMVEMVLNEFDNEFSPEIKWGLQMQRVWKEIFQYNADS